MVALFLALVNVVMAIHYKKKDFFQFNPFMMSCEISSYSSSKKVSLVLVTGPILLVELFALYTFYVSLKYLRHFPENVTKKLIAEIKLYPMAIFICYLPKIIKHIDKYIDSQNMEKFELIVLDRFILTTMGTLVCFIFVWKREGFQIKNFFKSPSVFENPTDQELSDFNYY